MRAIRVMIMSVVLGAATAGVVPASATGSDLEHTMKARYPVSRIEVENNRRQGVVTRTGTVLVLQEDGIPANELRVFRPADNPRSIVPSPARHLSNYARVDIGPDGIRTAETGAFRLARGTRLVVLDVRAGADGVRLLTHTAEPVAVGPGRAAHGCTEFVFRLEPALGRDRGDVAVQQVIERWLKLEAGGRAADVDAADGRLPA